MKTTRNRILCISAICCFLLMAGPLVSHAQKIGYVDSQYILNNIPEYNDAKEQLDILSKGWQREIDGELKDLKKLEKAYIAEKILMTDETKREKKKEIRDKEREIEALRIEYFGVNGELFKKRQELIRPIQDKIYEAIKEVATNGSYVIFFDKAGKPNNIMYVNPKYDKSDSVLKKLGYKPG